MKVWYIIHPIKLIVKDEIQSKLFYLFCDVPPKYMSVCIKIYSVKHLKILSKELEIIKIPLLC